MTTSIKNQIRKIIKRTGSHLGVVRFTITNDNPGVDFNEYVDFTNSLIEKKMKNTESKIRASIRFNS